MWDLTAESAPVAAVLLSRWPFVHDTVAQPLSETQRESQRESERVRKRVRERESQREPERVRESQRETSPSRARIWLDGTMAVGPMSAPQPPG